MPTFLLAESTVIAAPESVVPSVRGVAAGEVREVSTPVVVHDALVPSVVSSFPELLVWLGNTPVPVPHDGLAAAPLVVRNCPELPGVKAVQADALRYITDP
jgi:hypothetical protein